MKKITYLLFGMMLFIVLSACNSGEEDENKLVVYSPNSEDIINTIIPMFEQETDIEVELVSAGTGELLKRIETEAGNPNGDIMFGGSKAQMLGQAGLFEEYTSANNDKMLSDHQNVDGFLTPYGADGSVILVNTDLIGDIEINGYEDLLNPELKGKIAGADPASSSSAFAQLTNMLMAMGGDYSSDEGWSYVEELVRNMDGKVASGSGAVHKGVADGEYTVGLTYEDPALSYVRDGAPVEVIYPEEGAVFLDAGVEIIKDAKHMDNAKAFVDFITSEKAQNAFAQELTIRSLGKDVEVADYKKPFDEINVIQEDEEYVEENRNEIVDKYKDVFTGAQE
ncbi:ABC transporter substrate-binding protein [Gracilibacillus timonensis]|uniref:ABC transporter substrate-binding protein n=1 Tax=Gracilibacillus timonensis TaxID=1816696 RepID=UPI0008270E36|nr:ABC transporter substrate-binding protein [Gracilibacillus timonensis]